MCDYLGLVWLKSVTFVNEFEAKMTTNVLKQDQNTEKLKGNTRFNSTTESSASFQCDNQTDNTATNDEMDQL